MFVAPGLLNCCLLPNAFGLFYILRETNFGWVTRSGHIFDSASSPGLDFLAGLSCLDGSRGLLDDPCLDNASADQYISFSIYSPLDQPRGLQRGFVFLGQQTCRLSPRSNGLSHLLMGRTSSTLPKRPTATPQGKNNGPFRSRLRNSHLSPSASCLFFFCCLLSKFALFYVKITSAGSPDPVTCSIPHPRPDWLSPAGLCIHDFRNQKSRLDPVPTLHPLYKAHLLVA